MAASGESIVARRAEGARPAGGRPRGVAEDAPRRPLAGDRRESAGARIGRAQADRTSPGSTGRAGREDPARSSRGRSPRQFAAACPGRPADPALAGCPCLLEAEKRGRFAGRCREACDASPGGGSTSVGELALSGHAPRARRTCADAGRPGRRGGRLEPDAQAGGRAHRSKREEARAEAGKAGRARTSLRAERRRWLGRKCDSHPTRLSSPRPPGPASHGARRLVRGPGGRRRRDRTCRS